MYSHFSIWQSDLISHVTLSNLTHTRMRMHVLLATAPPVYGPDYAVGILLLQSDLNEVAGASSICYR